MATPMSDGGAVDLAALGISEPQLFEEIPCWASIQDREFRIIKASRKLVEDFGCRDNDKCWAVYKGRSERCTECIVAQTFEDGKGHNSRDILFDKRGLPHSLLVRTTPLRNRGGEVVAVMKVFADISSETELAGRLRDTLVRFHNLFENAPCFITVQDPKLRILESNRRFDESFGEGFGRHCYELYKKRQEPCPTCPVAETFQDGEVHTSEELLVDNRGRETHVLVYTAPVRDATGEITSVMEMATDVTEIRVLQNRLATLGQLVGGIAHNAKNILEGLRGGIYIGNLGFRDNNPEDIRAGWEMVQRNVGRLTSVILDMLYCARERSPRHLPVVLSEVAGEVIALFAPRAAEFQIELKKMVEVEAEILGEPKDIHALLSNLVSNAIDACNADPDDQKAHSVVVRLTREKGEAVIEVRDNGVGMESATRDALFRGMVSTKGNAGTGLGLLMSQKVATEHGGTIAVSSDPNQGSIFTVRLPVPQATGAPTKEEAQDDNAEKGASGR